MLRKVVLGAALLAAAARGAAAGPLEVPVAVAPPLAGWTLPAAVRAVALMNPAALPPGVSPAALAALPPASPLWSLAAQNIASAPTLNADAPAMVSAALTAAGRTAERRLDLTLKAARRGVSPAEKLGELADFAPVLPAKARAALERALAAHAAVSARASAGAADDAAALAAPDADPALLVSQYGVQHKKDLIRTVGEYEGLIAPRGMSLYARPNDSYASSRAVVPRAESLLPLLRDPRPLSAMTASLKNDRGRVVWADAGGGLGGALRQWSRDGRDPSVERVLVDLFDWERLSSARVTEASDYYDNVNLDGRSLLDRRHRPRVLPADLAAVKFAPESRPHLITSIESVQYWPDKIAVIVNLYNQLQDGGLLAIAAEHSWATWIRTQDVIVSHTSTVFDDLVAALSAAGVEVAAVVPHPGSPVEDLRSLVIRRKPGTRLTQSARLTGTWVNPHGYAASYYAPLPAGRAPISVLAAP
jgi:hypothetical protein